MNNASTCVVKCALTNNVVRIIKFIKDATSISHSFYVFNNTRLFRNLCVFFHWKIVSDIEVESLTSVFMLCK